MPNVPVRRPTRSKPHSDHAEHLFFFGPLGLDLKTHPGRCLFLPHQPPPAHQSGFLIDHLQGDPLSRRSRSHTDSSSINVPGGQNFVPTLLNIGGGTCWLRTGRPRKDATSSGATLALPLGGNLQGTGRKDSIEMFPDLIWRPWTLTKSYMSCEGQNPLANGLGPVASLLGKKISRPITIPLF